MKHPNTILAETFGWVPSEVKEYKYQRYANPSVYSVGDKYFAVSKAVPRHHVGLGWTLYKDQFFAAPENTTIWVCNVAEPTGEWKWK